MPKKWIPLESNPEVLNDFGTKIGLDVSRFSFCDVFGLDEELLSMVPKPVLAVLMCFPVTEDSDAAAKKEDESKTAEQAAGAPFYMKQTIGNACGTIAVIHALCNNQDALQADPDLFLRKFYDATHKLSPEERGAYLESPPEGAPDIEEAHQASAAEGSSAVPDEDDDVNLHFVAFVCDKGRLWQLDGRRKGPVDHGPTTPESLLADTAAVVRGFVERSNSVNFNLIALTKPEDDS